MSAHPVDELDQWEFDDKAAMAASMLRGHGHAFIDLQPRDGTTYKIVIVQPLLAANRARSETGWMVAPDRYWLGTSFGRLFPFSPKNHHDWTYVLDKWVDGDGGTAQWTARVLARFLNTLAVALSEAEVA